MTEEVFVPSRRKRGCKDAKGSGCGLAGALGSKAAHEPGNLGLVFGPNTEAGRGALGHAGVGQALCTRGLRRGGCEKNFGVDIWSRKMGSWSLIWIPAFSIKPVV